MKLAGDDAPAMDVVDETDTQADGKADNQTEQNQAQGMAPWIDTDQCTACDECINLNNKIFAYNDAKKAVIKDPKAGPYRDLVKAAEKCTAQVIHPGLPMDANEKDLDKWVARGGKYN